MSGCPAPIPSSGAQCLGACRTGKSGLQCCPRGQLPPPAANPTPPPAGKSKEERHVERAEREAGHAPTGAYANVSGVLALDRTTAPSASIITNQRCAEMLWP